MLSNVDFPQPDGPMIATNSPVAISRLTSLNALVSTSAVRNTFSTCSSFSICDSSLDVDAGYAAVSLVARRDHAFAGLEPGEDLELLEAAAARADRASRR